MQVCYTCIHLYKSLKCKAKDFLRNLHLVIRCLDKELISVDIIIHKGCKILQKGKKERNSPVPQSGATGSVDGEDKKGKVKQENSYEKIFLTINRQGKLFRAIEKGQFLEADYKLQYPWYI